MAEISKLQQQVQDLYPEEQFSNKELAKMERDVINFFSLLVDEYMKQEYKKESIKRTGCSLGRRPVL